MRCEILDPNYRCRTDNIIIRTTIPSTFHMIHYLTNNLSLVVIHYYERKVLSSRCDSIIIIWTVDNDNSLIDNDDNDNDSYQSQAEQPWRSIDDFRRYVQSKVNQFCKTTTTTTIKNYSDNDNILISIDQITRLANEEDGDCYLVGLEMNLLLLLLDDDDDHDDDATTREKFENVTDWLHPVAEVWVNGPQPLPLAPPYGYNQNDVTYNSTTT